MALLVGSDTMLKYLLIAAFIVLSFTNAAKLTTYRGTPIAASSILVVKPSL
jgi:hypothetical protein